MRCIRLGEDRGRARGCDVHLVSVGSTGFTVALTHGWLVSCDGPPCDEGVYIATLHVPDAYSEPYGADSWDLDLDPLELRLGQDGDA